MRQLKVYFNLLVLLTFSVATCSGNCPVQPSSSQLQVFVEPGASYRPVLDALNASRESILMEMYLLTDKKIIGALKRAKAGGANILIILEK
jgi:phosphatidylserine/phosphatidylglycerophosphate/cardiolipin synthase-like enzyme